MKKTQRMLALALVLAMAFTALFALVACQSECEKNGHKWDNGKCTVCEEVCEHPDGYSEIDGRCPTCGKGIVEDGAYWVDDNDGEYSYRMAPSDIPTAWNLHTYESASSTYILDYTGDALYTFDYNEDATGFVIVPSMASAMPVDVTAQYAGQYGIGADETENKAYKISLKDNLKFDNGDPITAETFVESMELLLNPDAANFRADNVYMYNLKIAGAEAYAKQGQTVVTDNGATGEYAEEDLVKGEDGIYKTPEGYDIYITVADGLSWLGGNPLAAYVNAYGSAYFGMEAYEQLIALANEDGRIAITDESLNLLEGVITAVPAWGESREDAFNYFVYIVDYPVADYDGTVGFFATDDNSLVVVLKNAMEDNFYLRYELCTSFFLVHPGKYRECIDMSSGLYTNDYGTSIDKFIGYGPYKLTTYVADSKIELTRNPYWHGYYEFDMYGQYQTDNVVYTKVTENSIRLEMFLKGELESYGLQAEDMADYINSDYLYYTDSESTWYLAMNPDFDTLEANQATATPVVAGNAVIKTVLDITEFRQGLSYALDREAFNLELSPTSGIAKALLSAMIVADPESGLTYRATEEGKDAILEFWGLADQWGEGKEYLTKDDAIASITGFDPEGAKALFETAYEKAVARGDITADMIASGKWEVQLCIGMPSEGNFYQKGSEFLQKCWTEAVKGTSFEGHVTFINSQVLGSTTFGEYLRNGSVDLLFGVGYSGSMFDPYSMMDCFTGSLQYDPLTDKNDVYLDIEIDGKVLRASLYAWTSECLLGETIKCDVIGADGKATGEKVEVRAGTSDDPALRVKILAKVEAKIMTLANIFPLMTDSSASLKSMRVQYKTDEYVVGLGFGGISHYRYARTDAEWKDYIEEQGGTLNYK